MSDETPLHDRLVAAHVEAQRFYRDQLLTSAVAQGPCHYLSQRRLMHVLSPDAIWQVGYAPASWTDLCDHLIHLGFDEEELLAAGLASCSRHGTVVDRFRDRLMLPQRNDSGNVVGFIGRAAPGASADVPKYLNSPQTPIYHKGESLFGLYEQRHAMAAGCRPVLVEGPLDVLAVSVSTTGRDPVAPLAPCGTALTRDHVEQLARHTPHDVDIVVAYDNDEAGRRATANAFEVLTDAIDRNAHALIAASLPRGTDPAELLQVHGPAALRAAVAGPTLTPLAERAIDARLEPWTPVLDGIDGQVAAAKDLAPLIARIPSADVAHQVVRLAGRLHLDPVTVSIAVTDALTTSLAPHSIAKRSRAVRREGNKSPPRSREGEVVPRDDLPSPVTTRFHPLSL